VEIITTMRIVATPISQKYDKIVKVRIKRPKTRLGRVGEEGELIGKGRVKPLGMGLNGI
jgi:hypothetical protein